MTPWTGAHQAPLSMEFSRQEYWSRLPFPSLGDCPDPGIEPAYPALQADSLSLSHQGSPRPPTSVPTHHRDGDILGFGAGVAGVGGGESWSHWHVLNIITEHHFYFPPFPGPDLDHTSQHHCLIVCRPKDWPIPFRHDLNSCE